LFKGHIYLFVTEQKLIISRHSEVIELIKGWQESDDSVSHPSQLLNFAKGEYSTSKQNADLNQVSF